MLESDTFRPVLKRQPSGVQMTGVEITLLSFLTLLLVQRKVWKYTAECHDILGKKKRHNPLYTGKRYPKGLRPLVNLRCRPQIVLLSKIHITTEPAVNTPTARPGMVYH